MAMTDLRGFRALSFDCYGTLIDWESGIWTALQPLISRLPEPVGRNEALAAFAELESRQQAATPTLRYAAVLAAVHGALARQWGIEPTETENRRFGGSVGDWPAFPDTADALLYLAGNHRLVILSNVDRASFAATAPKLGTSIAEVLTAEEIGSYKPDPRNFAYLIERLAAHGIAREQILHVAQSLFHDHAPANSAGIASAWIDRGHGPEGGGATARAPPGVRWDCRFATLGELADAHRAAARGVR
jgi:2-haloacid dehalogenase